MSLRHSLQMPIHRRRFMTIGKICNREVVYISPDVTVQAFPGALHDLVLSRREIRDSVFSQLFSWAERAAA